MDELKAILETLFTVSRVRDELKPWRLSPWYVRPPIREEPGFIATLDPPIETMPDHELIRHDIDMQMSTLDGFSPLPQPTLYRQGKNGQLEIFIRGQTSSCLPVGSRVRFVRRRSTTTSVGI
ncbi:MAG: hypothetical protein LLG01_19985 [Planctomycetaceae bacterium]|nr:hypothetical protein [Planctomycetaceae bacterium]